ncbi:MAG: M20/M25/M40 family metallo-hydrolase [Bacteroidales bacterium]|nr:M20/M25/M40 family metallo-hydrolase [Bacteroidales bacterium]
MNWSLFENILAVDSTSGVERNLAEFLEKKIPELSADCAGGDPCSARRFEVGDGTLNLLFSWGCAGDEIPEVCLCTHLDTVPPYLPPKFARINAGDCLPDGSAAGTDDLLVTGRGSNDAKGQVFSMLTACLELQKERTAGSWGLLLLAGEETGSFGARAFTKTGIQGSWVIVGEPTGNRMVSASKGTKSFRIIIRGKACHSGYPELGKSAVMLFNDFVNRLGAKDFPNDPILGATTWNIGCLTSGNPQNILSPELSFRLYFRTTFETDSIVASLPEEWKTEFPDIEVEAFGGDTPMKYDVLPGYETVPVSFGSDTPRLTEFRHRAMCGPGSIFVAHTAREFVLGSQLELARDQYKSMIKYILNR